jgi:hypothetical protein
MLYLDKSRLVSITIKSTIKATTPDWARSVSSSVKPIQRSVLVWHKLRYFGILVD